MLTTGRWYEKIILKICTQLVMGFFFQELEWCGSLSFLFLINKYISFKQDIVDSEARCINTQKLLDSEVYNISCLRRSMAQSHQTAQANEWNLLEKISNLNKLLNSERTCSELLRKDVINCQAKLVEVESFLSSDDGKFALHLEEQLAICKLRVAELEAEKDYYELELHNRLNGSHQTEGCSKG